MTYENASAFLPIVQAMAEGKKIQFRNPIGQWEILKPGHILSMERNPDDYQIVREPKIVWVNEYKNNSIMHQSKEEADAQSSKDRIACRKFIEVIEEADGQ